MCHQSEHIVSYIVTTHNNTIFEQKIFLDDCCVAENDVTQLTLNCRQTNLTFFIWNTIDGFVTYGLRNQRYLVFFKKINLTND